MPVAGFVRYTKFLQPQSQAALLVDLLFDAADNVLIVTRNFFRFVWVAALLADERVVRKEAIAQKNRGVLP